MLLKLPQEIRNLIYAAVWEDEGLTQHVYLSHGYYTHGRCITNHAAPDTRQVEAANIGQMVERASVEEMNEFSALWARRLASPWGNHWMCEEALDAAGTEDRGHGSPFLAMLLTCRQL